jgi:hypothetical protein
MGVISTAKVVTAVDKPRAVSVQPGNRQWVTVIESIGADGYTLPPLIIFKGKLLQQSWVDAIPSNWRVTVSENGWTTDNIGLN